MGIIQEFREFLEEYKVVGLAVAFIMGATVTTLVQSLVNDIIMPCINPLLASTGSDWKNATAVIGPVALKYGSFTSNLINFMIIAFVVFLIAKVVLKETKVTKK
ncbi:large-conductance mechanosensitive ion channel [Methanocella arvoryzae MRE50]|uniref:Large-conductance mechanosensitive ion channel n=2 Tax=Methanocella TaxID=570266 RepID=Q0W1L4_METAR|nr:large-conductance mechanosensitive ion channel [Methanocella arvoryzae MRE50]